MAFLHHRPRRGWPPCAFGLGLMTTTHAGRYARISCFSSQLRPACCLYPVQSPQIDYREARRDAQRDAAAEANLLATDVSESIMTAQTTVEQTLATPDLAAVFGGPAGSCNLVGSSVGPFSSANVHLLGPGGDV